MSEEQEPLTFIPDEVKHSTLMPWFDQVYDLPSYQAILDCGYEEVPFSEQKKRQKETLRLRPWNMRLGEEGYYEIVTTQQGMRGKKTMKVRAKLRERFSKNPAGYLVPDPYSRGLFSASRLITKLEEYDALLKEVHTHILRLKLVVPRPQHASESLQEPKQEPAKDDFVDVDEFMEALHAEYDERPNEHSL